MLDQTAYNQALMDENGWYLAEQTLTSRVFCHPSLKNASLTVMYACDPALLNLPACKNLYQDQLVLVLCAPFPQLTLSLSGLVQTFEPHYTALAMLPGSMDAMTLELFQTILRVNWSPGRKTREHQARLRVIQALWAEDPTWCQPVRVSRYSVRILDPPFGNAILCDHFTNAASAIVQQWSQHLLVPNKDDPSRLWSQTSCMIVPFNYSHHTTLEIKRAIASLPPKSHAQ